MHLSGVRALQVPSAARAGPIVFSFRKSTPPQNRQLNIWISNSKQ